MKKQLTKIQRALIQTAARQYGVSHNAIRIVGTLVLVNNIDPHILLMMPPKLPSINNASLVPNGIKLAKNNGELLTVDDKLHIAMFTHSLLSKLKAGDISDLEYAQLQSTYQIAMICLELLVNNSDKIGITQKQVSIMSQRYKEAFHAAESVLEDMNERYSKIGAYKATGDNIRCLEVLDSLLIEVIEHITVSDWHVSLEDLVKRLTLTSIEKYKKAA